MSVIIRVGPDQRMHLIAVLSTFHCCDEMPKVISLKRRKCSWVWSYTLVISVLWRLRQEGFCEGEASLGYSETLPQEEEGGRRRKGRERVVYGSNDSPQD